MDECLIKAVELRLRHLTGPQLEAAIHADDQSGFILVRPLVDPAAAVREGRSGHVLLFRRPDFRHRRQRGGGAPEGFRLSSRRERPAPQQHENSEAVLASELDRWLVEGNRELEQKDVSAAAATFERVLAKYPNDARAMYGLAIASVVSGNADRAKDLFQQITTASNSDAASASVDPEILAWSYVYLGRIHDLEGERDLAVSEYPRHWPSTTNLDARAAAQSGVDAAYKAPPHAGENQEPQQ